ncbi:MAG: hypothetical protein HY791_09815 [Deltaproteobacteria bacterium]|nr:hypothetical protein [Deltaproteobacteria bacterium]
MVENATNEPIRPSPMIWSVPVPTAILSQVVCFNISSPPERPAANTPRPSTQ